MIVLVHNILPPYRVPLFNAIRDEMAGSFCVLLSGATHPGRRSWRVPWESVRFDYRLLPGWHLDRPTVSFHLSFAVGRALDELRPSAVVLAGWDLPSCWTALGWCRRRGVPAIAWVESWSSSGRWRGTLTNTVRRAFLRGCRAALVPGHYARQFVAGLAPEIAMTAMPNSVDADELRLLPSADGSGAALFMGELSTRKGFDLVLEAAPRLLELQGELAVAGTGQLAATLERATRCDHRIRWLGFVEGAERLRALESAAVVLLPSRRDPWPLVSAEAIVSGRPVVLGPGVGSAPDLAGLGDFVGVMERPTAEELVRLVTSVAAVKVPDEPRSLFTPAQSAAAFVAAVKEVLQ